jgi:hypothetical protein
VGGAGPGLLLLPRSTLRCSAPAITDRPRRSRHPISSLLPAGTAAVTQQGHHHQQQQETAQGALEDEQRAQHQGEQQQQEEEDQEGLLQSDCYISSDESYDNSEYWTSDDEVEAEVGGLGAGAAGGCCWLGAAGAAGAAGGCCWGPLARWEAQLARWARAVFHHHQPPGPSSWEPAHQAPARQAH